MYQKHYDQKGVSPGYIKYRFDYRLNGQRNRKMVVCRKSAVDGIYRAWENQILSGVTKQYLFFQIIDQYLTNMEQRVQVGSITQARMCRVVQRLQDAKDYYGNCLVSSISRVNVQDYQLHLQSRGYKNCTVNAYTKVLHAVLVYAIDHNYYQGNNPVARQSMQDDSYRQVELTSDQITEIITSAKECDNNLYTACMIALFAGLRKGEICKLSWSDVDFKGDVINLQSHHTKTGKPRQVPLALELKQVLLERKLQTQNVKVITTGAGNLGNMWARFRDQLSCAVVNGQTLLFHDLRHVFGQKLMESGVDLIDISAWLGHSSIALTQARYVNISRKTNHHKINNLGQYLVNG